MTHEEARAAAEKVLKEQNTVPPHWKDYDAESLARFVLDLTDPTPATTEWYESLKPGSTGLDNKLFVGIEDGDMSAVHIDLGTDGYYNTVELSRIQLAVNPTRGEIRQLLAALGIPAAN